MASTKSEVSYTLPVFVRTQIEAVITELETATATLDLEHKQNRRRWKRIEDGTKEQDQLDDLNTLSQAARDCIVRAAGALEAIAFASQTE